MPASGKTTLAKKIVEKIDSLEDGVAVLVGLDGWHFRYLLIYHRTNALLHRSASNAVLRFL